MTCSPSTGWFGHRYRIGYEYQVSEWRAADRRWVARIACRYGDVVVQRGEQLYPLTTGWVIGTRVRAFPTSSGRREIARSG